MPAAAKKNPAQNEKLNVQLEQELVTRYGETQRERAHRGIAQVADVWRAEDGDAMAYAAFVRDNFAGTPEALDAMFSRYEYNLEQIDGHLHEINRELRTPSDLDTGPLAAYDDLFAAYDPTAHLLDDFFANKLAQIALLNFPLTTLEQRLTDGQHWTRRQWAETRLAERFSKRIPAAVTQAIADSASDSEKYIAEYNIWMHHLVDAQGNRLFPAKLRLLSHWNLRDEVKADYSDPDHGLAKQRAIQKVMARIVTQEIPAAVIDNPGVDWNLDTNAVTPTTDADGEPRAHAPGGNAREPDTRYAMLLADFQARRKADPYSPTAPTYVQRVFDEDMQIPQERVKAMLEQVLASPLVARTAALIEKRLGRPLEPFDVWYNGFRPRGSYTEAQLDEIVARKYPTAAAYKQDMPNILLKLGFSAQRAQYLAGNIIVDPARGSGHAMGAEMRSANPHLRTRVEAGGMNYKGYNIAVHEMGHNVEQTFSLNDIDHTLLHGVPNTAFTEALAFTFQNRDLELLGLTKPDAQSAALKTLNDFWSTYEIAGVALVDAGIWNWMYAHPKATPAQVRAATVDLAREVWNRYYAPVFHQQDVVLLGIYSHMINSFLYLPNYPLGHMIAFQIEAQMQRAGDFGREFERVAKIGRVTPDQWMIAATGAPVGPEALLTSTAQALDQLGAP
ncbi:MAG: hypothetical protein E6R07_01370 [Nevskiaceae bacterium]|nr:MAG: hypothetical protein E6R07_01370 [Nevskiaceae bacterium]